MKCLAVLLFLALSPSAFGKEIYIPNSTYVPVFKDPGEQNVSVGPLWVDETPVTNRDFLAFVRANPRFTRSKVPALYSDKAYLSHWTGDLSFAPAEADFPVTNVPWFIARKFCAFKGKRLPTIAEWEVFSDSQNPKLEAAILEWYAKPGSTLKKVGLSPANKFGIKDTHGLIWEWVDNFGEAIMSEDTRRADPLFCGGGSLKAKDPKRYAAFMRFAFRSSLTAKYNSANLGFRCVKDDSGGKR
jgi:formylglycine-generating enzyme required for sulfatase activity